MGIQQALFMVGGSGPSGSPLANGSNQFGFFDSTITSTSEAFTRFINTGGTIQQYSNSLNVVGPDWNVPQALGVGSFYWIRGTIVSGPSGGSIVGTPNVWISISTEVAFGITNSTYNTQAFVTWTFELATDSAGTNIIRTWSNNEYSAYPNNL